MLSDDCPHDREIDSCDAAGYKSEPYGCPSSESTQAIPRDFITWHLKEETPKHVVSDWGDVTPTVLDEHYNTLSDAKRLIFGKTTSRQPERVTSF